MTSNREFIDRLRKLLGEGGLLMPGEGIERFCLEPRGRFPGNPKAVARPADTGQVVEIIRACRTARVPVVPQGGCTGLVGGAMAGPGELVLSLERMAAIRRVDPDGAVIVAEAGCTLEAVRLAAGEAGLCFPVSLASGGSATVGGAVATNAGGNLTVRYGNMREQVLGLEVVLADGTVFHGLKGLRKDNAGYDLRQLFIGSEGTLGVVTAAALALAPLPAETLVAWAAVDSLNAAVALFGRLRRGLGETLSAVELISGQALELVLADLPDARGPLEVPAPWQLLIQADSALAGERLAEAAQTVLGRALESGIARDVVLAESPARAAELWRLREAIPGAQRAGGASIKHDISLPVASIPGFVADTLIAVEQAVPGLRPCIFGHLGDGNLHFNLSRPEGMSDGEFLAREPELNRIVFDRVQARAGSIAAEHGIGRLRRAELALRADPAALELMGRLKRALDPEGLLNPGKLLKPPPP